MKTHTIYKTITIGGKSKSWYEKELKNKNVYISTWAQQLLDRLEFSSKEETIELVKITPKEMGLTGYPTTEQIYARAQELGLELAPAETGPALRLATDSKDWMLIGMEQILDAGRGPDVFNLGEAGGGLELRALTAEPAKEWHGDRRWVFRIRKSDSGSLEPLGSLGSLDSLELSRAIEICKSNGLVVYKPL